MDKLLQAYDDGDLTRHELFVHLLLGLTPAQVDPLRARLRANGDCLAEFEEWLDDVAAGAQLSLGGEPAHLSEGALTAVVLWRNQTQPARYSRLAERIKRWLSERAELGMGLEPGDIQPFLSTDVEGMLTEVV